MGSLHLSTPDGKIHLFEGSNAPEIRADMDVRDPALFEQILTQGDWGVGWGYATGRWDSKHPGQIARVLMLNEEVFRPWVKLGQFLSPLMRGVNRRTNADQSRDEAVRQRTVGECYDVGNEFFEWMLGPSMVYTSGVWPGPDATLEEAQENKLRLVTEKAQIRSEHRVLDLGCGWGSLAGYIQRHTRAQVKAVALSRNQIEWAREHHPACEFEYLDYARISGSWDRIVSVGMAEHVGRMNMNDFLQLVCDHLVPGGRFVMHTMWSHDGVLMASRKKRWTSFGSVVMPNGDVPSMADIVRASLRTGLMRIVHTESFGVHYTRTGHAWIDNLTRHKRRVVERYSEELFRTYVYALGMGAAAMETGMTVGQLIFEKRPFGSPYTGTIR